MKFFFFLSFEIKKNIFYNTARVKRGSRSPLFNILVTRPGQSIKIVIGKAFDKSITIDINHVHVIDCIDQSIKIDTTFLVISVIDVIDFIYFINGCRSYMSLISGISCGVFVHNVFQ